MNRIQKIKNTYYAFNILYNMGIMVFGGTLYLYMKSIHDSYADINLFLSIFWIVGFITEIPSSVIADTFGRKKTLISSCVIRSIGLFLLFFDWGNMVFLILSSIFTLPGESLRSGTVDSWMIDSIREEE
ncbi:MFS transporter [Heyndrickxia coagulans]|uniref:MFS transporter n=2 Tax=Heyndrickxia coagulans TaxID=1398 RepID=UPI002E1AE097|nr:MFS transporter [Heyndrickxia coagulans]MED4962918.1 MFS transporter [Heyndrickxia coagulans]